MFFLLFATLSNAHGGNDPLKDLSKNQQKIAAAQINFSESENKSERIENLKRQIIYLQRNSLILRNLMASDYPHVQQNMSKYKLDYIEEVDKLLIILRSSLKQANGVLGE